MTDQLEVLVKFMALPEMLGIYIIHSVIDITSLEIELLTKTVQIKEMFRPT
jgi:hypothetical protein